VKIPAGIEHGSRLRVTGEGEAGQGGASRGDLYIQVLVKKNKTFERQGHDIYCEVLIPYTVAVLGGEVEAPTLTGKTGIEIAAGTPAGKVLKIKGEGVPVLGMEGRRGDEYVKVDIEVPAKVSKQERELLEKLAAERKEKIQTKKGFF
jgi:molecular chaperone DnaJ